MKLTRTISLLFLMLASTMLLGYTVLSHHHTGGNIYFFLNHICEEHDSGSQNAHDHSEPENCLTKEVVIINPSQTENTIFPQHILPALFFCICATNHAIEQPSLGLLLGHPPFLESLYNSYAVQSFGLRAPPAIIS